MKMLYSFCLYKEQEVEEAIESFNDQNEKVVTLKKVKKKIPHQFHILKPTRTLREKASLYFSVQVSEGVKAGLMTIPIIEKKHSLQGELFGDEEKKKYEKLWEEYLKTEESYQKLKMVKEEDRTPQDKTDLEATTNKIISLQLELQKQDQLRNNLFEHSAEMRARRLTLTWWVLHLAYKEENGKITEFFPGDDLNSKLQKYDDLTEQDDPFVMKVIEHFSCFVTLWFVNREDLNQENFDRLFKELNKETKEPAPEGA